MRSATKSAYYIRRAIQKAASSTAQFCRLVFQNLRRALFAIWRSGRDSLSVLQNLSAALSVLGFGYLVIDLRFQASPTLSSTVSDPTDPFRYPFSFTNNSHMFSVYDVGWSCRVEHMIIGNGNTFNNVAAFLGRRFAKILPGDVVNLDCKRAFSVTGAKISELSLSIDVNYVIYFFGFFPRPEHATTHFKWYAEASNPAWVKGQDAD